MPAKTLQKAREEHEAVLALHGRVQLIGPYTGSTLKTEYLCLRHGEIHLSIPNYVTKGGGLRCCLRRRVSQEKHAADVEKLGRVIFVGPWRGTQTKCSYRCIKHGEVHEAHPRQILSGGGLKCCVPDAITTRGKLLKARAAAKYDSELRIYGRLERVDEYVDARTKILHKCVEHGEVGLVAPTTARQGVGLACCLRAAVTANSRRQREEAAAIYRERLASHGRLEALDEYVDAKTPIMHRCLVHGYQQLSRPLNTLRGYGLSCCRAAAFTTDSVQHVLDGTGRYVSTQECCLYVFGLADNPEYSKPGIAKDPVKRARLSKGQYGEEHLRLVLGTREEAFFLEQAVLSTTRGIAGYPEELEDWDGRTEVRAMPAEDLVPTVLRLAEEMEEMGVWEFAALRVPMSCAQRAICQQRALAGAPACAAAQ